MVFEVANRGSGDQQGPWTVGGGAKTAAHSRGLSPVRTRHITIQSQFQLTFLGERRRTGGAATRR
jgi:hypothetical protein